MTCNAFTFQTLHPDTIMDALFEQGIRVDSGLTPLNSYENRVYQFQDEDRKRYVVKFYRPERWSAEQILEEHEFALDLHRDDVPVAVPLAFNNQTLLTHQDFFFAVFPSVGGRQFEADNLDQMEWVGRYLGRMHQTGSKKRFTSRPEIGVKEYLIEPRHLFETSTLIPSGLKDEFLRAADKLIDAVMGQWHNRFNLLRLHGDCHAGNILWRDGPMFVDLDDARNGPAVQDLWMLLHGDKAEQRMQLEMIVEAYEEFSEFNVAELGLIEPLRAMRLVYYLAWLIRRWDDPAFPKNFPWLSSEDHWHRQILIFLEQVKVLQEPPLALTPMY
ncbi:serine/threonine protein kinase [Kosakonia pseudosacchari]|uniref:Stress response kinase A n=1 Tax=Kosakonia pseudosacchari TaxID=1646340 RepID=A0ABX4IJ08_9ENTR|nr:serine/threonine protein kinase [Kosakonia pseudosacchari]PDO83078.1 stress response serine/threonine protein kinase YihE [Kosakonia pseudosacchari]